MSLILHRWAVCCFCVLAGSGALAQSAFTSTTPQQAPVQVVVPAPGQLPPAAPTGPTEPAFDPESGSGSQNYNQIYTQQPKAPAPRKLPRYTGKVGDFDRHAVQLEIQGKWYRLPRSVFGDTEIRSGEKASFRMAPEQLRVYRVKR